MNWRNYCVSWTILITFWFSRLKDPISGDYDAGIKRLNPSHWPIFHKLELRPYNSANRISSIGNSAQSEWDLMRLPVLEQPTSSPLMQSRKRCYIDICRRHLHHHLIVNKVGAVQEQNNNNHIFSRDIPLTSPIPLPSPFIYPPHSPHPLRFHLIICNDSNLQGSWTETILQ